MCLSYITKRYKPNEETVVGYQVKLKKIIKEKEKFTGRFYSAKLHTFSRFTKCEPKTCREKTAYSQSQYYKPGFHIYSNVEGALELYKEGGNANMGMKLVICKVEGKGIICRGSQSFEVHVCEKMKILKVYKRPPRRKAN